MIVSASYKTDIPAFYSQWFRNRLRAGYCRMVNPHNAKQHYKVGLRPETGASGFVFWTKNIAPFFDSLLDVQSMGLPFIVNYTVNAYPRALETRVVEPSKSIEAIKRLANDFGPKVVVWRYDPIIVSSLTPAEHHAQKFEELANQLRGSTDEVVVSFVQLYKKTLRNMKASADERGFRWTDPDTDAKKSLLTDLVAIAETNGMRLSICTQPELMVPGAKEARCIDADRLSAVGSSRIQAKLQGMRMGCGCFQSKDIGDYDTCPHGCVYCYAVNNRELALKRYKEHDPESEFLFTQVEHDPAKDEQLELF